MAVSSIRPPSRLASSSSKLHAKKVARGERALSLQPEILHCVQDDNPGAGKQRVLSLLSLRSFTSFRMTIFVQDDNPENVEVTGVQDCPPFTVLRRTVAPVP